MNNTGTVRIPCVEGGSGEESYGNNSLLQNYNFHTFAKPHLSQALDHLVNHFFPLGTPSTKSGNPVSAPRHDDDHIVQLRVADFGCSYGPNTLHSAAFIVQGLYTRLQNRVDPSGAGVEMQYFFADLPSNNFNALLRSVEPFLQQHLQCCFDDPAGAPNMKCKLFTAAVAKSFHAQLFPTASLHLAISSYAVHWLSQVPPEVVDKYSPAWNGGHIWIHGARPKVVEAYAHQFQKDLKCFLHNRAKEMANGGLLFLFFPCRAQKHPPGAFLTPNHDIWTGYYESTWEEMVLEGLIRKEERDMFNIPFYNCHKTEFEEVLDKLSNEFKVVKMDVLRDCANLPKEEEERIMGDPEAFGKFVKTFVASLMKPMVQEYLNESRANELFERLQTQASKASYLSTSMTKDMLAAIIQRL